MVSDSEREEGELEEGEIEKGDSEEEVSSFAPAGHECPVRPRRASCASAVATSMHHIPPPPPCPWGRHQAWLCALSARPSIHPGMPGRGQRCAGRRAPCSAARRRPPLVAGTAAARALVPQTAGALRAARARASAGAQQRQAPLQRRRRQSTASQPAPQPVPQPRAGSEAAARKDAGVPAGPPRRPWLIPAAGPGRDAAGARGRLAAAALQQQPRSSGV